MRPTGKRGPKPMAEEIMGYREGYVVDHKNRNTLDHTRENLRYATRQQNCRNRIMPNKSGLPMGVTKNGSRFMVRLNTGDAGQRYIGQYATAEEAHEAYKTASRVAFGEFSPFRDSN